MIPKPQWEKDSETLATLRERIEEKDAGRRAHYRENDGLTVTMWSGAIIVVPVRECTPYVAANFLDLVGMGGVNVLKPIFETCKALQIIAPAKGSRPLITFF